MRLRALTLAALVAFVAAPACTQEDIVLGSVPADKSGAQSSTALVRCVTGAECGQGTFCNRHFCNAEAGNCEPFPVSCDDDEHPVCGCDGVTYFNDCLRRAAGVAGSDAEECTAVARTCDTQDDPCPQGAVCAMLAGFGGGGPSCKMPSGGRCWVIPDQCPANGRSDRWDECDGTGSQHCVRTCDAIKSKKPYVRALSCGP